MPPSSPRQQLLALWFGAPGPDGLPPPSVRERWFRVDPDFDALLRERFGDEVEAALAGRPAPADARGLLAEVLLVDQLPRNLFRGSPRAFAGDPRAVALAERALAQGLDRALPPAERSFLYLPFEHAEDAALQARAVACFEALAEEVGEAARPHFEEQLDYARRHQVVIERFGRFPHRNALLGRVSTPEEERFLAERDTPF